jgi:hypothetical protein
MFPIFPSIEGICQRRVIINYRVDPDFIAKQLPAHFTPLLVKDYAIAGICLIRLKEMRPMGFPKQLGFSSENAAPRIAVQWKENGISVPGAYIPQRYSSSSINSAVSGYFFPALFQHADFQCIESDDQYKIQVIANDGFKLEIDAHKTDQLQPESVFNSTEQASDFIKNAVIAYSPAQQKGRLNAIQLKTYSWKAEPLKLDLLRYNIIEAFPKGVATFDSALLMLNIKHEWHYAGSI